MIFVHTTCTSAQETYASGSFSSSTSTAILFDYVDSTSLITIDKLQLQGTETPFACDSLANSISLITSRASSGFTRSSAWPRIADTTSS